jgi:hypothetical protein
MALLLLLLLLLLLRLRPVAADFGRPDPRALYPSQ